MKPFLYLIAQTFYKKYGKEIQNIAFVFPNRRAGIFFQKYLAEVAGHPLFSPPIMTINDLFIRLTPYQPADKIQMLFVLYRHYITLSNSDESFDNFVFWGEMLLNDFDDVDKYVVNAKDLFTNIQDLKEIENRFSDILTETQIEFIRRFWDHFIPAMESEKKMQFVALWKILYPLYKALRDELKTKGIAYEGMIFREVAEKAKQREELHIPYNQVVFIGLNVLSTSEEMLMHRLKELDIADFYWDYNAPTLQDEYNKATFFLSRNRKAFPSKLLLANDKGKETWPEIELIGIPSAVGQAKQTQEILNGLISSGAIPDPSKAINTAIVLPDEHLLLPMLYSIPETIDPINVTMGYTLSNTPVAGLMESIFDLQKHYRMIQGEVQFYHRKVLSILSHRYILFSGENEINLLSKEIKQYNKVFIPVSELGRTELLKLLFVSLETANQAADYLINILEYLQQGLQNDHNDSEEEEHTVQFSEIEKEFLFHYYITVKRLKDVIKDENIQMNVSTFFRLLGKMAGSISIPFRGEPLSGLQIMGVLETRALDFENLIILSMNEGIFPMTKVANTFIPYHLRKGFGLSTIEHQDSIYAYYFYRMIYRAKRLYLLYDTRTEGLQTGEMSRYIYQLKYHYQVPIQEKVVSYDITVKENQIIQIPKNEFVQKQLNRFLSEGDRALSASAINTYIDCPLKFYLGYVERVSPEDEVAESIEASTFGSIYHGVMENIYQRMQGKLVTGDLLEKIQKDDTLLTNLIEAMFAKHYFQTSRIRPLTGQNYLTGEIIRKYVKQTLITDRKHTPFIYLHSEFPIDTTHTFDGTRQIRLKGSIDRIDEKDGITRIIDYKTGKGETTFKTMYDLFDPQKRDRPKAIMQVFMYAMIYSQINHPKSLCPGIYHLRDLFKIQFDWSIIHEIKTEKKRIEQTIYDFSPYIQEFTDTFNKCIQEIFNPEIPFKQTENTQICEYCDFATICKR